MSASKEPSTPAWTDPDDAPDLSAAEWRDKMNVAPVVRPRGRPPLAEQKVPTNLRLSPAVLDAFKETGPGWQTRIDAGLWDLIERLKNEEGAPSAAEYRKRALDEMIERRKKEERRA